MSVVQCGCSMVQLTDALALSLVSYTGKIIQHVCEDRRFETNSAGSPCFVEVGVAGW